MTGAMVTGERYLRMGTIAPEYPSAICTIPTTKMAPDKTCIVSRKCSLSPTMACREGLKMTEKVGGR